MTIEMIAAFVWALVAFERWFGWAFWAFDVIGWLVQEFAMGNLDFAFFDADDDDFHLVADFDYVIGIFDVFPIQSGNVA